MTDLLGIGVSGLLAFRRALDTTSHNISNVNTEGYSRQSVDFATRTPQRTGIGYFGQGVQVNAVQRQYDGFLTEQVRVHTALNSQLETYHTLASEVDNLLADAKAGLTPALEEFFGSVQDVANDPTSAAARQTLISVGEALTSRFNSIDQRFADLQSRSNRKLQATVDEINQMAASLAELNHQIVRAQGAAGGNPPNDLLDQRDLLLEKLSERVSVKTVEQGDGMTSVFIGTGQALVVGTTANSLGVTRNQYEPSQLDVTFGNSNTPITNLLTGGVLGGIADFQSEVLQPARQSLGRIALALGATFNEQHQLGMDLNGELGEEFFSDLTEVFAQPSGYNDTGTDMQFKAVITDVSQVTTSDYRLDYQGGNYSLTRVSDNTVVAGPMGSLASIPPSFDLTGILDADEPVGTQYSLGQFTLADDAGNSHTVDISFTKSAANTWDMSVVLDGDPGRYSETHQLVFNAGALDTIDGVPAGAGLLTLGTFVPGGGASDMDIEVDLSGLTEPSNALTGDTSVAESGLTNAAWAMEADGFHVVLDSGTSIANGDSFLIRPGYNAAREITMALSHPDKIAAASPVIAEEAYPPGSPQANVGTGMITPATLVNSALYQNETYSIQAVAQTAATADGTVGTISDADASSDLQYQLWINGTQVYTQDEADPVLADLDALAAAINGSPTNPGVVAYVDNGELFITNDPPSNNPVRIEERLVNTTGALNADDQVTGYFSGEVLNSGNPESDLLTLDSVTHYVVTDDLGNVQQGLGGAYDSNGTSIAFRGIETSLKGDLALGDAFTIGPNDGGIGDNRNMLALTDLQTTPILDNGSTDYQSSYAGLVAEVGTKTHVAKLNYDVEETMLDQAVQNRDAVSGVNLDEEAAKLMAYQQAYMATAKVITAADEMFNVLLGAVK